MQEIAFCAHFDACAREYYSKSNAYAEQAWRTHPDKINVYFVSSVPRRYSSEDFAYSIILSDLLRSFGHSSTTRYH